MKDQTSPVRISDLPHSEPNNNQGSPQSQGNSSLDKRNINEKFEIRVFPHCVEFRTKDSPFHTDRIPRRKRGNITHFSKRSRFRLFALLAKMPEDYSICPIFVTLTYHFGHQNVNNPTKSQLHHFLVMLRQNDPNVKYIWRIELQKRKAPHYHFIIFPGTSQQSLDHHDYCLFVSRIWHNIADPNSKAHAEYGCKIVKIDNYRKACAYLSKYIAKCNDDKDYFEVGKHWGNAQNMPFDLKESITFLEGGAQAIIEKLRKWLIENGKEQYADDHYFNILRDQTVFIDWREFFMLHQGFTDQEKHDQDLENEYYLEHN